MSDVDGEEGAPTYEQTQERVVEILTQLRSSFEYKQLQAAHDFGSLMSTAAAPDVVQVILELGGLKMIVDRIRSSSRRAKGFASLMLAKACADQQCRAICFELGAIEPLVACIRYGTGDGQAYASAAIAAMADSPEVIQMAERFGVIAPLCSLLLKLSGINENAELAESLKLDAAIARSQQIPMAAMSAMWITNAERTAKHGSGTLGNKMSTKSTSNSSLESTASGNGDDLKAKPLEHRVALKYVCEAVANLGAIEEAALAFVTKGVAPALERCLTWEDTDVQAAAAHAVRNLTAFDSCLVEFAEETVIQQLGRLTQVSRLGAGDAGRVDCMANAAGALWNLSRTSVMAQIIAEQDVPKLSLSMLPLIVEFEEQRRSVIAEAFECTVAELAGEQYLPFTRNLDRGYREHVMGVCGLIASFPALRKSLTSIPGLAQTLSKVLADGSPGARCNAAQVVHGLGLDKSFRHSVIQAGATKPLIRMLSATQREQMEAAGALGSLAMELADEGSEGAGNGNGGLEDHSYLDRLIYLLDGGDEKAAENAALALMTLTRNDHMRDLIVRGGAIKPLQKILSAKQNSKSSSADDEEGDSSGDGADAGEGTHNRLRDCSLELLWCIMLNLAQENSGKSQARLADLTTAAVKKIRASSARRLVKDPSATDLSAGNKEPDDWLS